MNNTRWWIFHSAEEGMCNNCILWTFHSRPIEIPFRGVRGNGIRSSISVACKDSDGLKVPKHKLLYDTWGFYFSQAIWNQTSWCIHCHAIGMEMDTDFIMPMAIHLPKIFFRTVPVRKSLQYWCWVVVTFALAFTPFKRIST